ncbi:MAG: exodeoxyribonuclease VII small subunit [Bacteroides sp.]|nr:exodeoxyribonuclease VII small subunit [Clostridia bacterium]
MAKTTTIEDSFSQLDEIITQLESGELSLEASFKKYNEGMKLIKNCNQQLDKVEKQIIVLESDEGKEDAI